MRVIADHMRASVFLLADGVRPENTGRGYVLRRILRRAARHGKMLGLDEPFLYRLVDAVLQVMGTAYPELTQQADYIAKVLLGEEERFLHTLHQGLRELDALMEQHRADGSSRITGTEAFRLYDTFGFPIDLATEVAVERGMDLDREGFEATLDNTRQQARETWKGSGEVLVAPVYQNVLQRLGGCDFLGYETDRTTSPVAAIIADQQSIQEAAAGQEIELVFPSTPFYGEAGGQIGDSGAAVAPEMGVEIEIRDTQKPLEDLIVHRGVVKRGVVKPDMPLELVIDTERREAIRKNHTATHLLHAALRQVLGDHVKQAGSLVAPDRLRFDFTHFSRLSERDIERIETLVNEEIWANTALNTSVQDLDSAIAGGALALFGEKYGDNVRTVQVPGFSHELCGGTHVGATGEIGFFTLTYEGGIGSGVRRVEALTGPGAFARVKREGRVLTDLRQVLKAQPDEEMDKLQRLTAQQRELERQIEALQQRLASAQTQDHFGNVQDVAGMKTLAICLDNFDRKALRSFVDTAKERLGSGVVVAGSVSDDKVALVAGVTSDLTAKLSAGDLLGKVAALTGGKGGGRADMAQGGGTDARKLPDAIAQVPDIITALVGEGDDA